MNLSSLMIGLYNKLLFEIRWAFKKDWEIIATGSHDRTHLGNIPISGGCFSWEIWRDKRTGKKRYTEY